MYDYLIVGSGLYGSVFAHEMHKAGKKVLVVEKREHCGGNCYTKEVEGIHTHVYGAHIFHTSNKATWEYINKFATFNNFINSPIAIHKGTIYNLPFNMNTFYQLWKTATPNEAKKKIAEQIQQNVTWQTASNLEEQAISLVGRDIYEILIKGYTEKQWGRNCTELPPFIIKRLPVRFTFDNNYFSDTFQGIPIGGYTQIFKKMLKGIEVRYNTDFLSHKEELAKIAKKVLYTGMIDEYYGFKFGHLDYRSLSFKNKTIECDNFQGNAVVNYTEKKVPYTRIIEHKHFDFGNQPKTLITYEYPSKWEIGNEPFYPINDKINNDLYSKYQDLASKETNILFGGRLANYKYFDMHVTIDKALETVQKELLG